jgi:hypothetical protein
MLSEQSVFGTHGVAAITYDIATHFGLHVLIKGKKVIIHEHNIRNLPNVVMVKQGFSLANPLPLNLFSHRTLMNGRTGGGRSMPKRESSIQRLVFWRGYRPAL